MSGMQSLQEKLVQAKRVMDAVGDTSPIRNTQTNSTSETNYNLPPVSNNFNSGSINSVIQENNSLTRPTVTEEKVKNSNLPDAIKKLMIDHPIPEVSFGNQIPDSLIEGAAEKMKKLSGVQPTTQSFTNNIKQKTSNNATQKISQSSLKNLVKETIKDSLEELINETISNRIIENKNLNESIQIVVGNTVFKGTIHKTRKIK